MIENVMRIWSSGEEAYVAPNVEAVLEFHRTEYGLQDGDFPAAEEWTEQTGEVSVSFENEMVDDKLRQGAIRIAPGKRGEFTRITKLAPDWCKGVVKTEMLWSTNW
jgi:hypothetical protein